MFLTASLATLSQTAAACSESSAAHLTSSAYQRLKCVYLAGSFVETAATCSSSCVKFAHRSAFWCSTTLALCEGISQSGLLEISVVFDIGACFSSCICQRASRPRFYSVLVGEYS